MSSQGESAPSSQGEEMFDVLSDMSRVRLFTKEEGGSQKECDGETNKREGRKRMGVKMLTGKNNS